MRRTLVWLVIVVSGSTHLLVAQTDTRSDRKSPVFKNYRPPTSAFLLEQSNVTYQMWQGFRVLQDANAGNAVSQFELSIRYLTGRGFKADTVRAVYWTNQAAERNHLLARFNLGIFQFNGWGTEWNPFEAFRNFRYAAERGIPEAQYVVSQLYLENLIVPKNIDLAYKWASSAADSGYAPAKEAMKEFEKRGYTPKQGSTTSSSDDVRTGTSQNATSSPSSSGSLQLLFLDFTQDTVKPSPDSVLVSDGIRAAGLMNNDSVLAVFNSIAAKGGILSMDSSGIAGLIRLADVGSPEALTLLARCYELGAFLTTDPIKAALHYLRAVRYDSPRAGRLLLALSQQSDFFVILKSAVGRGDPNAMYVWGTLVGLGFDRQLTDAQALQMLERASEQKHVHALTELALAYYSGRWVKQSFPVAEQLLRRAISLGSREAQIRLAVVVVRSQGRPTADALEVLHTAAAQGSVLAEFALGYCYQTGTGVAVNRGEAARLYRNSSQRGSQDAYHALAGMYDEVRPADHQFRVGR